MTFVVPKRYYLNVYNKHKNIINIVLPNVLSRFSLKGNIKKIFIMFSAAIKVVLHVSIF